MSALSGLVGAVREAWDELRVHRTRVLLSLIGVGVAVCALTSVVGVGQIAQQAQTEQMERGGGRPATLVLGVPYDPVAGTQGDAALLADVVETAVERYSIEYSGTSTWQQIEVQFIDGVSLADVQVVDVDYGVMHRTQVAEGRWFVDEDELRMAPAIIINDVTWQRMGAPDLRTHPTVTILGQQDVTAVVVGVLPPEQYDESTRMFLLSSAYEAVAPPVVDGMVPYVQYEFWVPPDMADELTTLLQRDVTAAFGEGWQVDVTRQDYLAWQGGDPLEPVKLVLAGISVLILLLGALSLVNISLVTVR